MTGTSHGQHVIGDKTDKNARAGRERLNEWKYDAQGIGKWNRTSEEMPSMHFNLVGPTRPPPVVFRRPSYRCYSTFESSPCCCFLLVLKINAGMLTLEWPPTSTTPLTSLGTNGNKRASWDDCVLLPLLPLLLPGPPQPIAVEVALTLR